MMKFRGKPGELLTPSTNLAFDTALSIVDKLHTQYVVNKEEAEYKQMKQRTDQNKSKHGLAMSGIRG